MDKKKLESFKKKLRQEKERIGDELKSLDAQNLAAACKDCGQDLEGDAAADMYDRERDMSLENNLVDLLAQVDSALARIEGGTYGLCEKCKQPIAPARLQAIPYTALCLADKESEESPR